MAKDDKYNPSPLQRLIQSVSSKKKEDDNNLIVLDEWSGGLKTSPYKRVDTPIFQVYKPRQMGKSLTQQELVELWKQMKMPIETESEEPIIEETINDPVDLGEWDVKNYGGSDTDTTRGISTVQPEGADGGDDSSTAKIVYRGVI